MSKQIEQDGVEKHLSEAGASQQSIAEQCAAKVLANDRVVAGFGIVLEDVAEGRAVMSMTVRPDMLNSQGKCHGGLLFTLADAAFAFACVSCNQAGIGAHAAMDYIRGADEGDVLTATSVVRHRGNSASLVEVTVVNQLGKQVALLHGRSHNFGRPFLDGGIGTVPDVVSK